MRAIGASHQKSKDVRPHCYCAHLHTRKWIKFTHNNSQTDPGKRTNCIWWKRVIKTVMVFLCNALHIPRATAVLVCYGPPSWMVGICVTNWRRGWDSKDFYWRRRRNNRSLTEFQLSNDARQRRRRRNARTSPPGVPLINFNDGGRGGGVRQRFIFYTQKNHNFRICLPKKITTFF